MLMGSSILCGDHGVKQIDKPFVSESDNTDEWEL
jgi:hypothetical protein